MRAFSLEPEEFRAMVNAVRDAEKSLGSVTYDLSDKMRKSREFSRSLFVVKDIEEGEIDQGKYTVYKAAVTGFIPGCLKDVIGKKACRFLKSGTPLRWYDRIVRIFMM